MSSYKNFAAFALVAALATTSACTPKIGSEAWCEKLSATPKVDWSMRDATDFTKYCVLKQDPDK